MRYQASFGCDGPGSVTDLCRGPARARLVGAAERTMHRESISPGRSGECLVGAGPPRSRPEPIDADRAVPGMAEAVDGCPHHGL